MHVGFFAHLGRSWVPNGPFGSKLVQKTQREKQYLAYTRQRYPATLTLYVYSVGPATKGWKQPGLRCAPPGRPRPRPRPYTTAQAESPHSTHRTHNTHTARTLADAQFPFGTSPALQLMLSSNARGDGNLSTMQSPATKNQGFLRYNVRG